jgi:hypothetical protein
LRKSLIAAAVVAGALTSGVAVAQDNPTSVVKVTVSPSKAGTTKKPKAVKLVLTVTNNVSTQTAAALKIVAPSQITLTTKDFKLCDADKLANNGPTACPSGSQVGPVAQAHAMAAVNGTAPAPVTFNVTPYATGKKTIGFYLNLGGGNIAGLAVGTISGHVLSVKIPATPAQQFPAGVYNALLDLTTNLWVKSGKSVAKLTGCPSSKKLSFKSTITFVPNPGPPATPTSTATATAACK